MCRKKNTEMCEKRHSDVEQTTRCVKTAQRCVKQTKKFKQPTKFSWLAGNLLVMNCSRPGGGWWAAWPQHAGGRGGFNWQRMPPPLHTKSTSRPTAPSKGAFVLSVSSPTAFKMRLVRSYEGFTLPSRPATRSHFHGPGGEPLEGLIKVKFPY